MTTNKLPLRLAIAVVIVAGVWVLMKQHQDQVMLREQNALLRVQAEQMAGEAQQLSDQVALAGSAQTAAGEQFRELVRLRGQVSALKRQLADTANARDKSVHAPPPGAAIDPQEQHEQISMRPRRDAKILGLAFRLYALEHRDQFPTDFAQATPYFPEALKADLNPDDTLRDVADVIAQMTNQFEIAYQGSYTNLEEGNVILLRGKQATQCPDGSWLKVYCFADGSAQAHVEPDGNFEPWENQHLIGSSTVSQPSR